MCYILTSAKQGSLSPQYPKGHQVNNIVTSNAQSTKLLTTLPALFRQRTLHRFISKQIKEIFQSALQIKIPQKRAHTSLKNGTEVHLETVSEAISAPGSADPQQAKKKLSVVRIISGKIQSFANPPLDQSCWHS